MCQGDVNATLSTRLQSVPGDRHLSDPGPQNGPGERWSDHANYGAQTLPPMQLFSDVFAKRTDRNSDRSAGLIVPSSLKSERER